MDDTSVPLRIPPAQADGNHGQEEYSLAYTSSYVFRLGSSLRTLPLQFVDVNGFMALAAKAEAEAVQRQVNHRRGVEGDQLAQY